MKSYAAAASKVSQQQGNRREEKAVDMMEIEDVEEDEDEDILATKVAQGKGEQIAGLGPDLTPLRPSGAGTAAATEAVAAAKVEQAPSSSGPSPSRWHIIHPVYMNSLRTIEQGRRIPKAKAVDNPTLQEMVDSCTFLKVPVIPEVDKFYSRDYKWSPDSGRIRVQLKDSNGKPLNPEIPNKIALMLKLAALIPKHHGRTRKDAGPKKEEAVKEKKGAPEKEKKGKGKKKK